MVIAWWKDETVVLYNNKYEPVEDRTKHLQQKVAVIALFFGSYRNKSTKHFIKYLNKFYAYVMEQNANFEIVYVPLDEDEADCVFFVTTIMSNWLVVPWSNQQTRRNARNMYNVLDQPWLVIVKNDEIGSLVSFEGKSDLLDYGYFSLTEWEKAAKNVVIVKDE